MEQADFRFFDFYAHESVLLDDGISNERYGIYDGDTRR